MQDTTSGCILGHSLLRGYVQQNRTCSSTHMRDGGGVEVGESELVKFKMA